MNKKYISVAGVNPHLIYAPRGCAGIRISVLSALQTRIEDLVDEMLAILSDRDAIIQKKEMEHAQVVINEIYRNGL